MYPEGQHDDTNTSKKKRRCYHRVISGIERGGQLRFLTLTSSPESPKDIQKSWRALYMRLFRRGLITGYIKVPEYTKRGKAHLHVLYRGKYIDHYIIRSMWQEIHRASIVDIRLVKPKYSNKQMANELAKYMAKKNAGRYSWSWGWVWKAFCRDWTRLKQLFNYNNFYGPLEPFSGLIKLWRWFLHQKDESKLREYLEEWFPDKDKWRVYVKLSCAW